MNVLASGSADRHLPARSVPRVLLLLLLLFVAANLFLHIGEELHTYGDPGGESVALMASRHFLDKGFVEMRFLPIHNNGAGSLGELQEWVYTRYPPLPDLIVGGLRYMGAEALWPHRVLPILLNLAAIYLLFSLMALILQDAWLAFAVAAAYAMNFSFMKMADSFHYFGYAEFLRFAIVLLVCRWMMETAAGRKRLWFWLAVLASFLNVWITFDYIVHSILLCGLLGFFFLHGGATGWGRIRTGLVAMAPVAVVSVLAFALRIVHNAWYYGSFYTAAEQFGLHILYRVFNYKIPAGAVVEPLDLPNIALTIVARIAYSFGFDSAGVSALRVAAHTSLCVAVPAAFAILVWRRQKSDPLYRRYALLLGCMAIANFSYVLMLPQWAFHHFGLAGVRHILPTYAMITGGGLYLLVRELISRYPQLQAASQEVTRSGADAVRALRGNARPLTVTAGMLVIACAYSYVLAWNARDVLRNWRSSEQTSWASRFDHMDRIGKHIPKHAFVIGNVFWRPEARYRFDRRVAIAEDLPYLRLKWWEIESADIPRYFVFYERWGKGDDGFFPNYQPDEKGAERESRRLLSWLTENAEFLAESGRWKLFRLTREPAASEAAKAAS